MQEDFHYYATYCAAYIAGYSHKESLDIAYSAQFVDLCTRTLLAEIKGPLHAATTQLQLELMDAHTDMVGLQDITRIWASFHFLPGDLYADPGRKCSKRYRNKYRLICNPNGDLLVSTVELAKGRGLQAAGVAMHVLADTWAHRYFAGTPSLVINNTDYFFYELINENGKETERKVKWKHSPAGGDDTENGRYIGTIYTSNENSIMNLGHGRAGHLPDYSFIRYKYLPAWGDYEAVIKDNPVDYRNAFCQMIYALKYLRGIHDTFEKEKYDTEAISEWEAEIHEILTKRQVIACKEWKAFGEKLSGETIEDFDIKKYQEEYLQAEGDAQDETFIGRFILAALAQKSMVTGKIHGTGSLLAGYAVDYKEKGFQGIKDFRKLLEHLSGGKKDE